MKHICRAALFPLLVLTTGEPDALAEQRRRSGVEDLVSCDPRDRNCDAQNLLARQAGVSAKPQAPEAPLQPYVSFTTLAAPKPARKAFQKGDRELGAKRPDFAKASRLLEEAVSLYPAFMAAWQRLGQCRVATGDLQGATDAFRTAIAVDPKHPDPYVLLAHVEVMLARIDANGLRMLEIMRLTDRALKLDPSLSSAHFYRAIASSALGDGKSAMQSIHVILANGDDAGYPGIHAMLGEIRAAEGDVGAAVAEYQRYLELDPHSPASDEVRARLAEWQLNGRIR
ncbi:MAG: tetratricopeptide repeat protein [Bryobacterales bacterium]|nr:tetratricopeptide repeat protein [Bryobacterales bacterium]